MLSWLFFRPVAGLVSLYGLVADPVTITRQISSLAYVLPEEARKILIDQFTSVAAKTRASAQPQSGLQPCAYIVECGQRHEGDGDRHQYCL